MRRTVVFLMLVGASGWSHAQEVKPYLRIETGAHTNAVHEIDLDAAQRFLVSVSMDKTARVWDLRTGNLLKILRPPIGDSKEGMLYAVAISPDGRNVAVGGYTSAPDAAEFPIYIFDRESGTIRRSIPRLPTVTHRVAFSKDGRYLAATLHGKNGIRIFETAGYSEVREDTDYGDSSYWIEFDESGRVVTTSLDGSVRLYDSDFHRLKKEKPPGGEQLISARFSPNGKLIAVGFNDTATLDVLSADDLSFQYQLQPPDSKMNLNLGLVSSSWSMDGRTLCAAGRYTTNDVNPVLCWSDAGKGILSTFPVAGESIFDIRALREGGMAFAAGDGTVGILGPNGKAQWLAAVEVLNYRINGAFPLVSSDGDHIEVAGHYFNGTEWTRHILRFSVAERKLEVDVKGESLVSRPITEGLAVAGWYDTFAPTIGGHALQLQDNERSHSLAIAAKKGSFVLGAAFNIYRFDGQGKQIWKTPTAGDAWGVNISADGRFVVATLSDGTVRWYTFDKGQEVLALLVDRDLRRWVAWNPDGFFTFERPAVRKGPKGVEAENVRPLRDSASLGQSGDALIGYQINRGPGREGEFIKVDQLREIFYRPDLIAQILKPGGAKVVLAARNRIGDISNALSGGLPPEIELISPAEATVANEYLLQFRIKDSGRGHGRIVYRVDGVEIEGRGEVDIAGTTTDTNNRYVPVAGGTHSVAVTVYSANDKIESSPKTVKITRSPSVVGSNLYVIAAGISHYSDKELWKGVRFASTDAEQIAEAFKGQGGKGLYRKVTTVPLPDRQATALNIRSAITQAAHTIQPGDTFVLYLAGHGIAAGGDYYFIPWDAESTNPEQLLSKSLNREAIQRLLSQIPTNNSVLILDTCGAGAFLEGRGLEEKSVLDKLALMSGRSVLAASNTKEMAMEGYENHGVFTYALLEGLEKAEGNENGDILIDSLAVYLRNAVPRITNERWHLKQSPQISYQGAPFPIVRKLAH